MSRAYGYHGFGGPEQQSFFDRPDPRPGPGEILIRVRVAGVARLDHVLRSGFVPALNGHVPFPQVLGMEAAGDVLAVGAGAEGIEVGDAVFGFALNGAGTYAETTVLPAENVALKPPGLSYEWAASIPVSGTTALDVVDRLALPEGATVLLNGVGGSTGVATAQLASARGLRVIGVGSEGKRAVAERLGVTFVSYSAGDVSGQVRALAPGGVDGLVDLVGGDAMREVAESVKDTKQFLSIADAGVAELGGEFIVRRTGRAGLAAVAALMLDGSIDPHISRAYPFDRAADALAVVESGHATGKIVITLPG